MVARESHTVEAHESRATVTVRIMDVNDHLPTFESDVYEASIPENSPRGTSVITITVCGNHFIVHVHAKKERNIYSNAESKTLSSRLLGMIKE